MNKELKIVNPDVLIGIKKEVLLWQLYDGDHSTWGSF